jgi:glutamate-1-semialdehyde 2,1-aminomutase
MWTERLGFTAALATIKKMEEHSIQEKLVEYGVKLKNGWAKVSQEAGVKIKINGLNSIPNFSFDYDNNIELLTYFNQEMLERDFLSSSSTATTFAYTNEIIDNYLNNVADVYCKIHDLDFSVKNYLNGPVKHTTFARLTD